MAWYKAYQTLGRHPKTLKLARILNVDRRYAVGLLHDLFSWGLDAATKDGVLPGLVEDDIAAALDIPPKKAQLFVGALLDAGFLNWDGRDFRIHDWYEYNGRMTDKREADREKMQRYRERKTE